MKICRYNEDKLGVVVGDSLYDVTEWQTSVRNKWRYDRYGDAVVAALPSARKELEAAARKQPKIPLSQVKLLSPVARPSKVMAAPTNYNTHIEEMAARRTHIEDPAKRASPKIGQAGIFLKANSSVVGPSEGIPIRFPEGLNEFELELVVIIGKQGSYIKRENAIDHIGGYCLGLDMTVRGTQDRSFRKSCDGYSVLGPWIVTADEIKNPNEVVSTLHTGSTLRQTADTRHLIFDIEKLIEFASTFYTLYPGDIYYTGTPAGVGQVAPGDVLTLNSKNIGSFEIAVRA
jgi:2,4-diketo-3-deoxy-L-fuconate hydrolase